MNSLISRTARYAAVSALVAPLLFGGAALQAQEDGPPPDAVLARVDGVEILASDVADFIATLPPQVQQIPQAQLFPLAIREMVNTALLSTLARSDGLDQDPAVKRRIDSAVNQILRDEIIQKVGDGAITDEAIVAYYQINFAEKGGEIEVRARHILVDSQEEAEEIYELLEEGGDFQTLARERSTGPSAPAGGDLGYYKHSGLVKEFADVAWSMEIGGFSAPVKTKFGWHLIMVEDRRETAPPPLIEVYDQISQELFRAAITEVLELQRGKSEIILYDADGNILDQ
jgi:peptidyl-prolyl cis-trans isomerase C